MIVATVAPQGDDDTTRGNIGDAPCQDPGASARERYVFIVHSVVFRRTMTMKSYKRRARTLPARFGRVQHEKAPCAIPVHVRFVESSVPCGNTGLYAFKQDAGASAQVVYGNRRSRPSAPLSDHGIAPIEPST